MFDNDQDLPEHERDELPQPDGIRKDHAGTGAGVTGPAPGGSDPERVATTPAANDGPPGGAGSTAGGGYGVANEHPSSGGSGEGETSAGEDPQTQWLRSTKRQD
jgi:hypothetical protein